RKSNSEAAGRIPVADFAHRRISKQPAVLAAELRGTLIADTAAYGSDIFSFIPQEAPRFLQTKLLLILQRTQARDGAAQMRLGVGWWTLCETSYLSYSEWVLQ